MNKVSQQHSNEELENNNLPANTGITLDDVIAEKTKEKDEAKIAMEIAVMEPILRFLQLLCENHNSELQVLSCVLYITRSGFLLKRRSR